MNCPTCDRRRPLVLSEGRPYFGACRWCPPACLPVRASVRYDAKRGIVLLALLLTILILLVLA